MTSGLNKAALHKEKRAIAAYRAYLPALELKRASLAVALAAEKRAAGAAAARLEKLLSEAGAQFAMAAHANLDLESRTPAARALFSTETILGVSVPRFDGLSAPDLSFPMHVTPHWAPPFAARAYEAAALRWQVAIAATRMARLEAAIRKTSQRVNLLEKVLIPQAHAIVRSIEIRLADQERAGVVIAKIAKAKRQAGMAG
jgi:V/A-type H+-transporting ATPase subunit D